MYVHTQVDFEEEWESLQEIYDVYNPLLYSYLFNT